MDFSDKETRVLLQALYRFRGEVSGASQSEQNKSALVASVIDKIEAKAGKLAPERTGFDREMDESLAVLKTGRMGAARAAKTIGDLDKAVPAPKVKASASKSASATKGAAVPKKGKVAPAAKAAPKAKKAALVKSGPGKSGAPKKK